MSLALVACGSKPDSQRSQAAATQAQLDSLQSRLTKAAQGGSGGHQYGPPTGKIRIANLAEMNGKPIGPVDLYDVRPWVDSTAVPIIKNLAYGQVSDYVSPRAGDNYQGSPSQLYLLQVGQKNGRTPYGTNIDNSGFAATDQMTIALGPSTLSIGYPAIVEAGKRKPQWIDTSRTVPAGLALLITLQANMNVLDSLPELYLMIDGACPLASNFSGKIPTGVGSEVHFAVTPGTHTLGIVTSPRGHGLLNCNGKTPVPGSTSTATVTAGQRYIVFIYGMPRDGLKTSSVAIAGS
jgi:hypothetical protein